MPDDPVYACTNFTIPLDWRNETVGLGKLGLARYAVDPEQKVGSIFINDGAPIHRAHKSYIPTLTSIVLNK